uniref:hypothetical protein n=1 Tax=Oligella urethralis TaxID=90245 RepID=UPI00288BA11F
MQRIQTADNRFAAGNPQLGTPGTIVTAKFLNDIQEEISNVIIDAGIELDGTAENQLSASIQKLISDRAMPFYSSIPSTKSNEVIYVIGIGVMEWRTFEWESSSWSGYATLLIGKYDYDTTELPRSMTIDALGDTFSKAQYPALWAWAQATGRVVSAASWINGIYRFVDLGSSFRVPDMRDQFIRATGTDADNANA